MIVTNSRNNLINYNFLFEVKECDPSNFEGIKCASPD